MNCNKLIKQKNDNNIIVQTFLSCFFKERFSEIFHLILKLFSIKKAALIQKKL